MLMRVGHAPSACLFVDGRLIYNGTPNDNHDDDDDDDDTVVEVVGKRRRVDLRDSLASSVHCGPDPRTKDSLRGPNLSLLY